MQRRDFFVKSGIAGATALAAGVVQAEPVAPQRKFKLSYAPHFGMFKQLAGKGSLDQLEFAADQGFTAWEDNGMKKTVGRRTRENRRQNATTRHPDGCVRG